MRVLLLSQAFPPDPEVGALRSAKVSEALAAAGHQVEVVTTRLPGEAQAVRPAGRGVTVHTVRPIPHPRKAYLWAKHWLGRNGTSPSTHADLRAPGTATWKRYLLSLMWLCPAPEGPREWRAMCRSDPANASPTDTPFAGVGSDARCERSRPGRRVEPPAA